MCSSDLHAYRPDHSALDAVRQVHGHVSTGHTEVVDADLSGYFDSIPHAELLKSLSRRISDRHLLGLIKMWLVGKRSAGPSLAQVVVCSRSPRAWLREDVSTRPNQPWRAW